MNAAGRVGDVVAEVRAELRRGSTPRSQAGIAPGQIAIDPGIGFAKPARHSVRMLRGSARHSPSLGYPVLVGVSRKSFIGAITEETQADRRLGGSLAAACSPLLRGANNPARP